MLVFLPPEPTRKVSAIEFGCLQAVPALKQTTTCVRAWGVFGVPFHTQADSHSPTHSGSGSGSGSGTTHTPSLSHTLTPTASPNLVCKGPIRPGQANTTPTRVGTTPPIITLVAGRTAHHASLAAAVLWPRGMRIHALHHCRAYTRDSPTFPSDRSSPTHLLSRPMTSAPPASPLPPRTWTATPTPSPITARTLPRRPSAMPERTQGVSLLSLTDCIRAPSHLSLQRLT